MNSNFGRLLKNATPRQVAIYTAAWVTLSILLIGLPLLLFNGSSYILPSLMALILITFACTYIFFLLTIKSYIYRRVKLIYKTIHNKKLSVEEKMQAVDVDKNVLEAVEKEVEEWVDTRENELQQYKIEAEYRRQFVGDISHELKTPIFIVQGYLETLLNGAWKDEQLCQKFLNKASKSAERLATIVQDLEAIARLESDTMMLDMKVFDIKKLVEEVFEELTPKAEERGIDLIFKEGADKAFKVFADEERIRQVLTNLIVNSIKYGQENGRTKVSFYDMDQRVLIEVSDNGIGIAEEHKKRIFNRFYRVDKSRSREQGGSGLGLAIVKHIIDVHEQSLNVRSALGRGTTFGFTLEMAK